MKPAVLIAMALLSLAICYFAVSHGMPFGLLKSSPSAKVVTLGQNASGGAKPITLRAARCEFTWAFGRLDGGMTMCIPIGSTK